MNLHTKFLRLASAIGVLTVLGGCGGETTDSSTPYKNQALNWQPCDESILGENASVLKSFGVTMSELGSRVTCAMMRAPINYANPGDGELQVALMRVAAEDPQQRLGAILFNPGGPGSDGLFLAPIYAAIWARADEGDAVGMLYKQMARRYDIIGFSPRGTGASTPLNCKSDALLKPIVNETADRSPENIRAMLDNARIKAEACAKNSLTPYINSDATARDMDLVRHLLGDEKLNYYGISYGTWLGTWYAGLFPERVGRMLLTGVVDQTQSNAESFLNLPMGYQRVFDRLIVPYAARHAAIFSTGDSATRLGTLFAHFDINLKGAVSDVIESHLRNSSGATKAVLTMVAGEKIRQLLSESPTPNAALLRDKLTKSTIASPIDVEYNYSPDGRKLARQSLDAIAHDLAEQILTGYFSRQPPNQKLEYVDLPSAEALAYTVVSNDMPMRLNVDDWITLTNANSAQYSLVGGKFTSWPGLYWSGPTVRRPSFDSINRAGNIVLVHNEFDGVTTLEGAEKSLPELTSASFILIRDEYTHGTLFPYGDPCMDEPVARYFLYGTKPPPRTTCVGKKLYWDKSVF